MNDCNGQFSVVRGRRAPGRRSCLVAREAPGVRCFSTAFPFALQPIGTAAVNRRTPGAGASRLNPRLCGPISRPAYRSVRLCSDMLVHSAERVPGKAAYRRRRVEPAAFAKRLRRAKEARRYSYLPCVPIARLVRFGTLWCAFARLMTPSNAFLRFASRQTGEDGNHDLLLRLRGSASWRSSTCQRGRAWIGPVYAGLAGANRAAKPAKNRFTPVYAGLNLRATETGPNTGQFAFARISSHLLAFPGGKVMVRCAFVTETRGGGCAGSRHLRRGHQSTKYG